MGFISQIFGHGGDLSALKMAAKMSSKIYKVRIQETWGPNDFAENPFVLSMLYAKG